MVFRDVLEDGMRYGGVKLAKPHDYSAKPPSPQIASQFDQSNRMKVSSPLARLRERGYLSSKSGRSEKEEQPSCNRPADSALTPARRFPLWR